MRFKHFALFLFFLQTTGLVFGASNPASWCGTKGPEQTQLMIKEHEARTGGFEATTALSAQTDFGDIAFMVANNRTLIQPNAFDLPSRKIAFQRTSAGDYTIKMSGGSVAGTQGSPITLGDDDFKQIPFNSGFSFPFYGTTYTSIFVNSDGNLTFVAGDKDQSARDVTRVLTGPPRLAPFFQDMNPSAHGTINVLQTATKFTVTWNAVTQYQNTGFNSNTFQVNLFKNGNIEFIYGVIQSREAVVGISPGHSTAASLRLVNYSSLTTLAGVKGSVLERFATQTAIDFVALINDFHATHSQIYDFVVIYADFPIRLGFGAFAFFSPTANDIKGIGLQQFNFTAPFGSPKLQGFLAMGSLSNYPNDPNQKFLGENSTMGIMGQENGHRWLAFPQVLINGVKTKDLLGRDDAHWNFYMDSDSSVMEGNDIRDNGNGTYTTVNAVTTYSKLDQYMMGLVPPSAVPPFFFVNGGFTDQGRSPQIGVTFPGTKVNVTLSQLIQANGARVPATAAAQKKFKEAWILFSKSATPKQTDLSKMNSIRTTWQAFFHKQTGNRGTIDTTLAPLPDR